MTLRWSSRAALDVPVLLARWRTRELGLAHTFKECARMSTAEIEEILDGTITALLSRPYTSEEHLFAALRKGVKMRALRRHRDRAERERILTHTAPAIYASERDRAWREEPERVLIAREDDLIISEFLSDLTKQEREVFVLHADGRSWRAIATALRLPESEARALTRTCERKRKRFLTLYLTGRLCGYRSRTISNLLTGALSGNQELALEQALAHLKHCRACKAEHQITSQELRNSFDRRALTLLPPPLTSTHMGLLDRAEALIERPLRVLQHSTLSRATGARERLAATIAGTGTAAKIGAGLVSVAVLAGGTLSVSHALHSSQRHHTHPPAVLRPSAPTDGQKTTLPVGLAGSQPRPLARSSSNTRQDTHTAFGPGQAIPSRPYRAHHQTAGQQHEPPGFAYLGVPTRDTPFKASVAVSRPVRAPLHSGGPFTP
jgi:DNA-directed RNA polymerase specialized sigma24 family protein